MEVRKYVYFRTKVLLYNVPSYVRRYAPAPRITVCLCDDLDEAVKAGDFLSAFSNKSHFLQASFSGVAPASHTPTRAGSERFTRKATPATHARATRAS